MSLFESSITGNILNDGNATIALRTTPADVDQKIATALLTYVQQVALMPRRLPLQPCKRPVTKPPCKYPAQLPRRLLAMSPLGTWPTTPLTSTSPLLKPGGGNNLINAQAWPGEITWDLLLALSREGSPSSPHTALAGPV